MGKITLEERIEEQIKRRGWTQGQLAARSGVKQGHISLILSGARRPRWDILAALARALDVSLDWLATGEMWERDALTPEEAAHVANLRAIREPAIVELILGMARDAARKGR